MVLEERKCPNCGSNEILEKNGTFVCMNCRTFFDRPKSTTTTHVYRNETEIERIKSNERLELERREREEARRKDKEGWKIAIWCIIIIGILDYLLLFAK